MDEKLGDTLIKHFKTIKNKFPIKAIVLDVRGNGGGSDNTYGKFLGKILKDTLQMNLTVGYVFSPLNGLKRDTIIKYGLTFKIKEPTFKNVEMFYSTIPKFSFFYPAKEQIPFEGPIYILQDRFIFSSSNNLSSIAYKTKNIISIGEMPNLLGGVQTRTAVYSLPFSKFIFRIEPQIDFTDCKTLADIFQNQVEHFVAYPIDFLHERATTKEDILGKDFLHHKDPMFKKVLELELKLPNEVQKPKS